jgi:NADH-quinone oxidoreductase subunit K
MNGTSVEPWMLLTVALIVFTVGLMGVILRKNLLVMLMCIELMLNAVNLCFVAFSRLHQVIDGDLTVLFVMTVAAAESAVGLGLVIALFRTLKTVDSDQIQMLRD